MHPPSRTRRILKWTGAGLSLLILAVRVLSLWYFARYGEPTHIVLSIDHGKIGWVFVSSASGDPPTSNDWVFSVGFSLWLLLLLIAIPTAWLWHRDRRRVRPGHCPRCGYDLTGNTSGVCSECGEAKPPPATV